MKKIIVPTDFSAVSLNAAHSAMHLAHDIGASIVLFHAYQVPIAFSEVPVVTASIDQLQSDSLERLAGLKKDLGHIAAGPTEIILESRMGDVVEELGSVCKTHQPFAVVMGTRGAGALERLILGSSTLSAIRRIAFPVIVVPPGALYRKIGRIGFASDLDDVKETTPAKGIADLVETLGADLLVLNVEEKEGHFTGDEFMETRHLYESLDHLNPSYHYIRSIDVAEGIHAFAEANGIDLLMVIPKRHGLIEGLFRKRQSSELVLHSHIPVASIHV